jgi:hypothetical protein
MFLSICTYTIISPKPLEVIIEHESRCDAQPAGAKCFAILKTFIIKIKY